MSIFITGDIHGDHSISKLSVNRFPIQKELTNDDYVIIAGDFGLVWDDSRREQYWRKWLSQKTFTTLWVDGNHENFPLLKSFKDEIWNGGKSKVITPKIRYLARGQVFEIEGVKIFTFGGASSHDKEWRTPGVSWWSEELPSHDEIESAYRVLEENNWKIDYVITHCAPSSIGWLINSNYKIDVCTEFLQDVSSRLDFKRWYFGHYHIDKIINEKFIACYHQIHRI